MFDVSPWLRSRANPWNTVQGPVCRWEEAREEKAGDLTLCDTTRPGGQEGKRVKLASNFLGTKRGEKSVLDDPDGNTRADIWEWSCAI